MNRNNCQCDEHSMCGPCLAKMEANMLRLRALPAPESGSLEDRLLWFLARRETPSQKDARESALYERFRIGSGPINSRGIRMAVKLI
jgi:hypothetical protein